MRPSGKVEAQLSRRFTGHGAPERLGAPHNVGPVSPGCGRTPKDVGQYHLGRTRVFVAVVNIHIVALHAVGGIKKTVRTMPYHTLYPCTFALTGGLFGNRKQAGRHTSYLSVGACAREPAAPPRPGSCVRVAHCPIGRQSQTPRPPIGYHLRPDCPRLHHDPPSFCISHLGMAPDIEIKSRSCPHRLPTGDREQKQLSSQLAMPPGARAASPAARWCVASVPVSPLAGKPHRASSRS